MQLINTKLDQCDFPFSVETWKTFILSAGTRTKLDGFISNIVFAGNLELLKFALAPLLKHENYGFNKLHLDVISLDRLTEKIHTASITKKAQSCFNMTPLHFSCLNPSTQVLETLLE